MSFPSVVVVAQERGLVLGALSAADAKAVLLEAVRRDCPEAIAFLHQLSHEAQKAEDGSVMWTRDPNSTIGKQLIRIHASDAVRPLVEEGVCHGMQLTFLNCCGGRVGLPKPKEPDDLVQLQIAMQAGPIAYADC